MRRPFTLLLLICLSKTTPLTPQGLPSQSPSPPKTPTWRQILFSPRMDYDEWTPLGRGDPLKNDPTYDYVPPVLERVHYWMDPSKRTPDPLQPPNTQNLLHKSRTDSTLTTRPTTTPRYQSKESHADSRIDTSSLLNPFFKLIDVSQFNLNFNSNTNYKPRIHHYTKPKPPPPQQPQLQPLQRPPYTMLMPPPPQSTNYITTIPLPTSTPNTTTTILANTENVFKPVAISMPEHVNLIENETQNEITTETTTNNYKQKQQATTNGQATTNNVHQATTNGQATTNNVHQATTNGHQPTTNQGHQPATHKRHQPTTNHGHQATTNPTKLSWFENRATITPPITTTKINTLTTDPMFKHYKQPSEPLKGPFYLIIQGHSKVKTYGASKNPVNKLLTSNEIKYDDDEVKKTKFERKTRRLQLNLPGEEEENKLEELPSSNLPDNIETLEDTFGKTKGGSSKKRYLGSNHRRKRSVISKSRRRLLSEADCEVEGRNETLSPDNLDLESLIAISDDYDPEDVASILLKNDGSQGSGFGGLALSIASRSETEDEVM